MNYKPTYVTKSLLPKLNDFMDQVQEVWNSGQLTNHGVKVNSLEKILSEEVGKNVQCICNGTLALQIAIKAADLKNEVITTPFTYIATSSALLWQNCTPVFADIDPCTLTIDTESIKKKITKNTTGILATHVYGNPCDVAELEKIGKKHNIKIIYDAAHAFGAEYNQRSLLSFGDFSITSFHATKLFHTIEGGAIISSSKKDADRVNKLRNFGHSGTNEFEICGINGKMNEISAAMGLCLLPLIAKSIEKRKRISEIYEESVASAEFESISWRPGLKRNYAYFPIIFPTSISLENAKTKLEAKNIFPRKYFSPSLNVLRHIFQNNDNCPNAEDISQRILCLPLSAEIEEDQARIVIQIIKNI